MNTHASRTHHYFEALQSAEAELAEINQRQLEAQTKLDRARAEAEMALLLADVASVLRDVETRNLSEGKRLRVQGVRKRVFEVLGVAP